MHGIICIVCFVYPLKAGKLKCQSILLNWLRDVVNHFWWCCKTADTFQQYLVSKMNIYVLPSEYYSCWKVKCT